MKKSIAILFVVAALAAFGCSGETADTSSKNPDPQAETSSSVQKPGQNGAEVGAAELQPGMGASEADSRVGTASGAR